MKRAGCALIPCAGLWLAPLCQAESAADDPVPTVGVAQSAQQDAQGMRLGELSGRDQSTGERQAGGGSGSLGSGSVQSVIGLGFVLILILGGAGGLRYLARRQGGLMASMGPGGRAPTGLIEVLGRYPVARGQTLVLIKLDRRVLLLSQSVGGRAGAGGFTTLSEITDPDEVASILMRSREESGDSISHRFKSFLAGEEARTWEPGAESTQLDVPGGEFEGSYEDGPYRPGETVSPETGVGLLRRRVESLRSGGGR